VTDGPFVEAKDIVGGYTLIEARDLEQAVELSKGCPIFEADGAVKSAASDEDEHVTELEDHLFRREAGRMVATSTSIFGVHNLTAEDVVQDVFCRAP
jgi:hypothetical protein